VGQSTDGIVAYGYNLGGDEDEWKGLVGGRPAWLGEGRKDFAEVVAQRLLRAVDAPVPKYSWHAEGEVKKILQVEFARHCSCDYPEWILAVAGTVTTAYRGYPKLFDPGTRPVGADAILAKALATLELEVTGAPGWIVASYWDW